MAFNVNNLEGNEIYDDYVRQAPTRGRWGETWGAFKGSFWKVVLINILMLVCFAPAIAIIIFRNIFINGIGGQYPVNANTGVGYPAYPNIAGLSESVFLNADLIFYGALIAAGLIASIGFAGGAYSIRKLINTHGQFTFKGFFHGVKVCYLKTVIPVTVFLTFYFGSVIVGDWKDLVIAQGESAAGPITAYVFVIIATVLAGLYCAWLFAVGASYRLKVKDIINNSFVMLFKSHIYTVFFAGLALMPVWAYILAVTMLVSGNIIFVLLASILFLMLVLFGLSFVLLVWMSYTQWIFDMNVEPVFKAEDVKAQKAEEEVLDPAEERKRIARELLAAGRSELIAKPILPISENVAVAPLGKTYTRADLNKVYEDRQKLNGEIAAYEQKHINDPVYAEYNKLFAEREKALPAETDKKGKKKKKVSSANLLSR